MTDESNILGKDLAAMLKGGVIMDVMTAEQAIIAQEAGACAVMALERIPADIRAQGGVARMSDPKLIAEIQQAVSIPVMAKVRIGHIAEARILEAMEIDFIDESEVLTPADPFAHIKKQAFKVPFVCGATNLGEALRRIEEGAAMIRTKGEPGTGNIVEAVRHMKLISGQIASLKEMAEQEIAAFASKERVSPTLAERVRDAGRLPVVTFVAGGVATPADAALLMEMGAEGVFVGSGIFKSECPERMAESIVQATVHFADAKKLLAVSTGLGEAMRGEEIENIEVRMQERGV
jgi:pyridoxal 5'-phosphate synthase pdxS subunit